MSASNYFGLACLIFLAPHLGGVFGSIMGLVCLAMQLFLLHKGE